MIDYKDDALYLRLDEALKTDVILRGCPSIREVIIEELRYKFNHLGGNLDEHLYDALSYTPYTRFLPPYLVERFVGALVQAAVNA